jgi:hypothetical protein
MKLKFKLTLILVSLMLLFLLSATAQASPDEVEVFLSHPSSIGADEVAEIEVHVMNWYNDKELKNVVIIPGVVSPIGEGDRFLQNLVTISTIDPKTQGSRTLTFEPGSSGVKQLNFTVHYDVYYVNASLYLEGLEIEKITTIQVEPVSPLVEIEVTEYDALIFDGDRVEVVANVLNVGNGTAYNVIVSSSTGEQRVVGTLGAGAEEEVTLFLEDYTIGTNNVEIYVSYTGGISEPWSLQFEARLPAESITLRVIDAPASIYEGVIFTAEIEVQNLRQESVSGTRIRSGSDVLYYVGALDANELLTIELRLDEYRIGDNRLLLIAEHEYGSAPAVPLEFEVLPAESAAKAYLASLSSPIYLSETVELSIVLAASEDAGISELELKALSEGIQPRGYYLGGEVVAQEELPEIDIGTLLTPGPQDEEEPGRVVIGSELNFEVKGLAVGNQSLRFEITYRLGDALVAREFSVNVSVRQPSSIKLIQADPVVAIRGEEAIVMLHVANNLPIDIYAVSVVPVGDFQAYPDEFIIGGMSPDDFLPAYFEVLTSELQDGDELCFKIVYRVDRETYETSPLCTAINLQEPQGRNLGVYIVPPIIGVMVVSLFLWLRRRRRGPTRALSNGG